MTTKRPVRISFAHLSNGKKPAAKPAAARPVPRKPNSRHDFSHLQPAPDAPVPKPAEASREEVAAGWDKALTHWAGVAATARGQRMPGRN